MSVTYHKLTFVRPLIVLNLLSTTTTFGDVVTDATVVVALAAAVVASTAAVAAFDAAIATVAATVGESIAIAIATTTCDLNSSLQQPQPESFLSVFDRIFGTPIHISSGRLLETPIQSFSDEILSDETDDTGKHGTQIHIISDTGFMYSQSKTRLSCKTKFLVRQLRRRVSVGGDNG